MTVNGRTGTKALSGALKVIHKLLASGVVDEIMQQKQFHNSTEIVTSLMLENVSIIQPSSCIQ